MTRRGSSAPSAWRWIVEDEGEAPRILGFLVAHRVDAEWELENIVVAEAARRRGVGTRLLEEFSRPCCARNMGSGIFLEVRESNLSARALYRKLGFQETGLRKSYYSQPPGGRNPLSPKALLDGFS